VLRAVEKERLTGGLHPELLLPASRGSILDPYEDRLRQLLEDFPDMTAMRVLEELQAQGFTGKYSIVKERVRELRPRPLTDPVWRFETGKAKQAQMDYSEYTLDFIEEGRRRVYLFSYILGYSRRRYHRWVESQNFATTVREHIRAFTYFGGLAEVCLYDGMKVVVLRYEDDEPIYNPRFLAFCTHYGYRPWACKRFRARTKGKVERPFHFVKTSLLNGRKFRSLAHLNEVTEWWIANVADVRPNKTTKCPPRDRFEEERAHLLPIPTHHYDTAEVAYRVVDAEGGVSFGGNFYSVPWQYIGSLIPVRTTETQLIAYSPKIAEIARHELFPRHVKGERRINKAHLPGEDLRKKYRIMRSRYEEFGPVGLRFLDSIVEKRRYGKNEAYKILALLGTYHREDFVAALHRAVRYGAFSMQAIERILAVEAVPRTPIEALGRAEARRISEHFSHEPLTPRPTKAYEALYPEEGEYDDGATAQEA
jgi:transposase